MSPFQMAYIAHNMVVKTAKPSMDKINANGLPEKTSFVGIVSIKNDAVDQQMIMAHKKYNLPR